MPATGFLEINSSKAFQLLNDIEIAYNKWFLKKYGKEPSITLQSSGITKFWRDTVGKKLLELGYLSSYRILYDIHLSRSKGTESPYYFDLLKNGKLFEEFLHKDYSAYGRVVPAKPKTNRNAEIIENSYTDGDNPYAVTKATKPLYKKIVKGKWFLFSFTEKHIDYANHKSFGLNQSVIEFKEDKGQTDKFRWSIRLWTEINNRTVVYNGFFGIRMTKENHIYLETFGLELKERSKRHLRIMLYFGKNELNELAIGVYYNIRFHGALLAGSVLVISANDDPDYAELLESNMYVRNYTKRIELRERYRKSVWSFFERRNLNFLKLPNLRNENQEDVNYHTLKGLENIVKKHSAESRGKEIWLPEYTAFISIPLTYFGGESLFIKNKAIADEIIEEMCSMKNLGKRDFYFAAKGKTFLQMTTNSEIPRKTIYALERSPVFILILPINHSKSKSANSMVTDKISSSFTELGYAMALKKRIFVFAEKGYESILPSNIELLKSQGFLRVWTFNREQIGTTLNENKDSILEHFDNI